MWDSDRPALLPSAIYIDSYEAFLGLPAVTERGSSLGSSVWGSTSRECKSWAESGVLAGCFSWEQKGESFP